jgi:hypothetical protein
VSTMVFSHVPVLVDRSEEARTCYCKGLYHDPGCWVLPELQREAEMATTTVDEQSIGDATGLNPVLQGVPLKPDPLCQFVGHLWISCQDGCVRCGEIQVFHVEHSVTVCSDLLHFGWGEHAAEA